MCLIQTQWLTTNHRAVKDSLESINRAIGTDTKLIAILGLHPEHNKGILAIQQKQSTMTSYVPPSTPVYTPGRRTDREAIALHIDHVCVATPRHWITWGHTDGQAAMQPMAQCEGRKIWLLWDMQFSKKNQDAVAGMLENDSQLLDVEWAV